MVKNYTLSYILCAVVCVIMVAMWFMGTIKESTIFSWYIFAIVGNSLSVISAIGLNRLYPFAVTLFADFLFYVVIELDAPCSMNPLLLYGTLLLIMVLGLVAHYLWRRRDPYKLLIFLVADIALNGLFFGLDKGWLMI